jgi:WD40 repeat protein
MPGYQILASVGDDETLKFWDLTKKQMIVNRFLGAQATALAFSPDGSYLIIGLLNGVMLVLETKIGKLNFGSYMEEYVLPSLDVKMSPKEAKAAVICIKFSYKGDYLAVSFNNETREYIPGKTNAAEIGAIEPSFVLIYINRLSSKNPENSK